jgi:uncharacterized repeat protein (TIGR03803 family)
MTNFCVRHRLASVSQVQGTMTAKRTSLKLIFTSLAFCLAAAIASPAQNFRSLVSFDLTDGAFPFYGSLTPDANGNLYGTTLDGGSYFVGTVFEITASGELITLYNFCSQNGCTDGVSPYGSMVFGPDGNLYGTTYSGGTNFYGTIFQITPEGALTTIYNFCSQANCADGGNPQNGLTVSKNGLLYGTTSYGGTNLAGTIFSVTLSGTLTVLHNFCSETNCNDGEVVYSTLLEASNGTLYGTTNLGGRKNWGTVFSVTPAGKFTTLHSFVYTEGGGPIGGLVQGANGDFYGTTGVGGKADSGTVFQMSKGNKFTTIYNFCAKTYCADGAAPFGTLFQGANGKLYGTTAAGGIHGWGTIFEITTVGALKTLHAFLDTDGNEPFAGLVRGANGYLYGTTYLGGDLGCTTPPLGCGTVFSLTQ